MPGILQEKFQVDYPQQGNDDAHSGWVSDRSARDKKGVSGQDSVVLPPGMDIEAQRLPPRAPMPMTMGGESDVSADWNPEAKAKGYKRLTMRATDDEYTKAHQDAFYDEMDVDGEVGFAERNNMLDRL
jgi:hypothetical protein